MKVNVIKKLRVKKIMVQKRMTVVELIWNKIRKINVRKNKGNYDKKNRN